MNLPNRLTMCRVAAVPLFIILSVEMPAPLALLFGIAGLDSFVRAYNGFIAGAGYIIAGCIFIAAFATDMLDGYIARKYNLVTDFGVFLDPIADKLLVTAALIVLTARGEAGVWVTVIIISREFIVTGIRLLASNKGIVIAAGGLGKMKTATQFIALTLLLFNNFNIAAINAVHASEIILFAACILTIVSGIDYIVKNRALFSN